MKIAIFFLLCCLTLIGFSQVEQLNSGTVVHLRDISVIGQNIIVCGHQDYLIKSTDECKSISTLPIPGPQGYINRLQRLNTQNMILLSYSTNETLLFKSLDDGKSWTQKSTTSGALSHDFGFFDSLVGLMTTGPFLSKTIDGGSSWSDIMAPFSVGMTALKIYGDSMICLGGFSSTSAALVLSKDRGQSWPYSAILWTTPTNVFFLNKDTIFGISSGGEFTKTTNGGLNWKLSNDFIIDAAYGIYFKNAKEGYITGKNSQNYGVVAKTIDLGETWMTFNTGVETTLMNLAILNDSIAILTGTDGVLLKWNYKNALFTPVEEFHFGDQSIRIFPNPVKDKLYFEFDNAIPDAINLFISNTLGQEVYSKNSIALTEEVDVSFLKSGVYYLKLESEKGQKVFKVVKE